MIVLVGLSRPKHIQLNTVGALHYRQLRIIMESQIQMEDRLNKEIKNNTTLLKIQSKLIKANDAYSSALTQLHHSTFPSSPPLQQVTPEQAQQLVTTIIAHQSTHSQHRWKTLYLNECQYNFNLTEENLRLHKQLAQAHQITTSNSLEIQTLFHDYLDLYSKMHQPTPKTKNRNKSLSNKKPQAIPQLTDQLNKLSKEVTQLRQQLIQKQQVIKAYREKQRERLLSPYHN